MRAFACSYLDEALQPDVRRVIDTLVAASQGRLRSIPADTAHLTYAFVATLPDVALSEAIAGLQALVRQAPPLDIVLGAPDVLYGGAEAQLVESRLGPAGPAYEVRARIPLAGDSGR
jgi:2'-5' RNA ligase